MIKIDIFFTNHLGETNALGDRIISVDLFTEKTKAYKTLTLEIKNIYIEPNLARDGVFRIQTKIEAQGVIKLEDFYIDDIKYGDKKSVTLICKTKGVILDKEYTGIITYSKGGTAKTVIEDIFTINGLPYNDSNLTDFNILNFTSDDLSYVEIINKILAITKAEIFVKDEIIYIQDKQKIGLNDTEVYSYDTLRSIMSFDTSTNKNNKKINKIYFNTVSTEEVFSEPLITLSIDPSPQPLSPSSVVSYIDGVTGNIYKIKPVKAMALIYYNPIGEDLTINGVSFTKQIDYKVLEKYQLENEAYLRVTAGIKTVAGLQLNDIDYTTYTFTDNIIFFSEPITGEVEISYTSDVYRAYIADNANKEKEVAISAKYKNQLLEYTHKWDFDGYYPKPYTFELNLVKDWNIDTQTAPNASGNILSVDSSGVKTITGSWQADVFGEVDITIQDYGVYVLSLAGYDDLYIKFYINSFSLDITPILPQ